MSKKKTHDEYVKELAIKNPNTEVVEQYIDTKTPILHHYWLERHNIVYVYQKIFDDCRDKNVLPFDFYLPDHNILIEYDGQQHFEPVDFAGHGAVWAEQQLKITQQHDNIKNIYCQQNNIRLLRISYLQDIDEELNNFFI